MTEIKLPEVGENIEKATVVRVLVKNGEHVDKEQPLLEIETDKATLEVPSPSSGKISDVLVKDGDEVAIGSTIFTIEGGSEGKPADGNKDAGEKQAPKEEISEEKGAKADKAKVESETESEEEPEIVIEEEDEEAPEETQAVASEDGDEPALSVETMTGKGDEGLGDAELPGAPERESVGSLAAPSVRRFAREIGVDLGEVHGSGPGGRITIDDVKVSSRREKSTAIAEGSRMLESPVSGLPDFSKWGPVTSEKLTGIRRTIAERLSYSWATIPHVHQYDIADITDLEKVRREHNDRLKEGQPKLTITAILLRVCARLLRKYPHFNSSLDLAGNRLIHKQYYHLGVAVDTDRGLLVPVIRDADRKSIMEMVTELDDLARRTRDKQIKPEEMRGATFTISNLGGIGGTSFNPIINHPEVAILGVARASRQAVLLQGELAERLMLPLCLAYDHRVIDGAEGARFLREIQEMLANPMDLMFGA